MMTENDVMWCNENMAKWPMKSNVIVIMVIERNNEEKIWNDINEIRIRSSNDNTMIMMKATVMIFSDNVIMKKNNEIMNEGKAKSVY